MPLDGSSIVRQVEMGALVLAGDASGQAEKSPPRKRLREASLRVGVLDGAGRVGLPLSIVLADRGHSVIVIDSDAGKLTAIEAGCFPFLENGGQEMLKRCLVNFPDRLEFTADFSAVSRCDIIVITVATPIDEHLNPHTAAVQANVERVIPHLHDGQTLIFRSTVFPGTSSQILSLLQASGLNVGVSSCPERLARGRVLEELLQTPQIISGSDIRALTHAKALFAPLGVDLVEVELIEAELAKLFLNAWRYVIFGIANQFYHITASKNMDFERIRSAVMCKYRRAAGFPSSGFTAGSHLFRDTMQLAAYSRQTFSLGHAAMLVNETMPDCILEQARNALEKAGRTLAGVTCGILGMAFKPNSDDHTESLAFKLRRLLTWEGAVVLCSDVYQSCGEMVSVDNLLARSELVFIGCPHREYRNVVFRPEQLVFDCWGTVSLSRDSILAGSGGRGGGSEQQLEGVEVGKHARGNGSVRGKLRVAVIGGAGHVGLPLSLVLADRGHFVTVIDRDEAKLESIRSGQFPFVERGGPELLKRCLTNFPERLVLTPENLSVRDSDVIILTIGTPVDEHLNPCLSVVETCIRDLLPFVNGQQTLLLRSTLFPGSSQRALSQLRSAGLDTGVSFCPERIAQGFALEELVELPQIISGSCPRALLHARALFEPLGVDMIELDLQEAEVAKLFLNAWRYVAFGIANQFYHIASSKGLSFERIRAAIVHRYPRASGFPRAGFTAGPCLFKDTMQLAAYSRHTFSLGHAAMLVNETLPDCLLAQAKKALAKIGETLAQKKCGILGMAFKPDNDDSRESLAFKLWRLVSWEGSEVLCSDVHLRRDGFVGAEELISRCEVIFVGCPHTDYGSLLFKPGQHVFDCWGFFNPPSLSITTAFTSK
eukprot:TRINITY_DN23720_c0_g1_i1.p1 TRINITY_DN23720_c0_g1~~TRINITY_DN23720_c0_g1_i1.p1  ORF type:complete len:885 (+),score=119.98 TRINITY_DN23720_c0_g1_i1:118-2772(+)